MSATQSKEERRNLRRQIGETAAGAMAECKSEVMKVRTANLEMATLLNVIDKRTQTHDQRIGAAMKLGFDNEKRLGEQVKRLELIIDEIRQKAGEERKLRVEMEARISDRDSREQTFFGRLKWFLRGC